MRSAAVFFLTALLSSVFAMQVTSPGRGTVWTSSGPNTIEWTSVETDPSTFKAVLITRDLKATELAATVQTSAGKLTVTNPVPVGNFYRVNFLSLSGTQQAILAQSEEFNITQGTGTASIATATSLSSVVPTTQTGATVTRSTSTGAGATPATGTEVVTVNPAGSTSAASLSFKSSGLLLGAVSAVYALVL